MTRIPNEIISDLEIPRDLILPQAFCMFSPALTVGSAVRLAKAVLFLSVMLIIINLTSPVHLRFMTTNIQESYYGHYTSIPHVQSVLNMQTFEALYLDAISVIRIQYPVTCEMSLFYWSLDNSAHNANRCINSNSVNTP